MPFLDEVHQRVVIYDGAVGTNLHLREPTTDDYGGPEHEGCVDLLSLTRPDFVRDLHASFFGVGVDVVETNTFGAFATVLAEYDLQDRAHEMCFAAARIACEVRDDFVTDGRPRWVAGSMGPGTKLPSLGHVPFAALRDAYEEMARGLLAGGVDLLLIETCYDLLQAKAAMIAARRAMAAEGRLVPIQLQVTMETTGRMLVGSEIGAAL
ncbi:MAG TPA: homocysteine S-methyltransferase family protein, partial [Acidimicrobiales bacterium]|nr:homocysteine S-methyltransferase family protein [Acidimicrobiales bacterium]